MADPSPMLDHPVLTCTRVIGAALDEVAGVDPVYMATSVKAAVLRELSQVSERVQGLVLRVLANADDVALDEGARSAAAWLAHETRAGHSAASDGHLAEALDTRWRHVQEALLAGRVTVEQTRVIVDALDALPTDLDPELRVKAEAHLISEAAHFDPKRLRVLGRKVLEVIAPDVFDDTERKLLEDEERRARQTTRLVLRKRGDGSTDISIRVADAVAGRLMTYLQAYAAPRRGHLDPTIEHTDPETGLRVAYSVLLGHAFCAMLEAIPNRRLPRHGGSATTVVVTIDYDKLHSDLGAAGLLDGERVSASEAMRLACNAQIVPLVLGGKGQPLHLGRASRLFDAKQRLAMAVRDGRCRTHGCTIPADWCEAHHQATPWSRGGRTNIEDGILLCSWHHHRAHDPDYTTARTPDGDLRFHRRT